MTIVNPAMAVLSAVASLIAVWQLWLYLSERDHISWKVVERAMLNLIKQFHRGIPKPDLIVGVGRGGAIVGGMLAGNLGHVPLCVIDTKLDKSTKMTRALVRHPEMLPNVEGKRVIIAVGELWSGEDLKAVVNFVAPLNPADITTLSLFSHPAASITPDMVGKETKRPLDAPWRLTDEYRSKRV